MLPVNKAKSTRPTEGRIAPGCLVEYQQHGKSIAAITRSEQSGKWALVNEQGSDVYLPPARLTLLPGGPPDISREAKAQTAYLQKLSSKADSLISNVDLEEAWEVFSSEVREVSVQDVVELVFGTIGAAEYLAVLRLFLNDSVYFKRQKSGFNYEPRSAEAVTELKRQAAVEREKEKQHRQLIAAILQRLKNPNDASPLPERILLLEQLAAFGAKAGQAKEAKQLLQQISDEARVNLSGRVEDKAFSLLVKIKHFSPHQNIAAIRYGRTKSFTDELVEEANTLANNLSGALADAAREDLRALDIVSIDNVDTKDIDDAISVEPLEAGLRVGIHIADASAIIPPSSSLFEEALFRATSIYCPDETINMLPSNLSEDSLSLVAGQDRPAISFFIDFDQQSHATSRRIVRSVVNVNHRLNYDQVDAFLYNDAVYEPLPNRELEEQLLSLYELTSWLETRRMENGGMQFNRREMTPRLTDSGDIELESSADNTPARKLVSELMVCANETAALWAQEHGFPMIFRAQEPPDVEPATLGLSVPEGPAREYQQRGVLKRSTTSAVPSPHFGLAVDAYVHCTSPIRRVCDLINQSQLSSYLMDHTARYSAEEITQLINRIEANLSEAQEIQRERNRYWLLTYLKRLGKKEIDGLVIRTEGPRPLAEIDITYSLMSFYPLGYAHGSNVQCSKRPGEKVKLNIEKNDPRTLTLKLVEIA